MSVSKGNMLPFVPVQAGSCLAPANARPQASSHSPTGHPSYHGDSFAGYYNIAASSMSPPTPHQPIHLAYHLQTSPILTSSSHHHYSSAPYRPHFHPYMAPTATSAQMEARPWNDSSVMDSGYPCTNPKAAEEREHKRRKSHSQMERRRRERTNAVINDLKALIPSLQNRDKPQKLEVLEKCVQYIRELQSTANFPLSSLKRRRHRVQSFDSKVERFGQESDDERNSCASHYLTSASPLQRRRRLSVTVKNSTSLSSPFSSMLPSGGGAIWSSAMPLSNARAAGDRVVTAIDAVSADTCTEDWGAFGRQLTGNNLPDLAVHSAVSSSSNASPIKSNIVLFHSPLPMISCDSDFKKLASANTAGLSRQSSPGGKTSIDFLIT